MHAQTVCTRRSLSSPLSAWVRGYTCKSLLQKTLRIESPISLNCPQTILIPNLSSLAFSWPPYISLLHDLIFVPRFVKALPLAWSSTFAGSVGGIPDVASSCSFAKKKNVFESWLNRSLPLSHSHAHTHTQTKVILV